jgi:hypothetical protein
MSLAQKQKSGETDVAVTPTREDPLLQGTTSQKVAPETGVSNTNALVDQLALAYNEIPGGNNPLSEKLSHWQPRIQRVTNPVAMMTSAKKTNNQVDKSAGNYDKAIKDKSAADGFYELAKAECDALAAEIRQFSGQSELSPEQSQQMIQLANFLTSYQQLYSTLQATGSSSNAEKRESMTQTANAALMNVKASREVISSEILGATAPVVDKAIDEIGLFVNSWSSIADEASTSNASPAMWASFLQSVERYRQILNYYDKLEAAGGDSVGTSQMAMREENGRTISDPEAADTKAMNEDGYMGMALKSYGFYTKDAALMLKQINAVLERVKAGEFETDEEALAAFKSTVGGGEASDTFMKCFDMSLKRTFKEPTKYSTKPKKDKDKNNAVKFSSTLFEYGWEKEISSVWTAEREDDLGGADLKSKLQFGVQEANTQAGIYYQEKSFKVGGSARAKYKMINGSAKLTTNPYAFSIGGEKMRTQFTVGVNAGLIAEAGGQIDLNVSKHEKSVGVEVEPGAGGGTKAGVDAFAGAKAGIETSAKLDWGKSTTYRSNVENYTRNQVHSLLGDYSDILPDYLFSEFASHFSSIVIGSGGWQNLAALKGGVQGSAGIGGNASFNLGLKGGRIKCGGALGATIGLGVGGKVGMELDAIDGMRFLGLMLFKTAQKVVNQFGITGGRIWKYIKKKGKQALRWLGKQVYDVGTSGNLDYVIPDDTAKWCARQLGYSC